MSSGGNALSKINVLRRSAGRPRRNSDDAIKASTPYADAINYLIGEKEVQALCHIETITPYEKKIYFKSSFIHQRKVAALRQRIQGIIQDDVQVPECHQQEAIDVAKSLMAETHTVYIAYIHQKQKFVLFSEVWEQLDKTKKRLQARFGRRRSCSRTRGRFGESVSEDEREVLPSDVTPEIKEMDSYSVQGNLLTIKIYKSSTSSLTVDAVVNSTHENLMYGAGSVRENESQGSSFIRKLNALRREPPLPATDLTVISGNGQNCKVVFNLGGLQFSTAKAKSKYLDDLRSVVLKCLCIARNRNLTSLAIPFVSSALEVSTPVQCAKVYMRAVRSFDTVVGDGSLREVHFVDVSDDMVTVLRQELHNAWSQNPSQKDLEKDGQIIKMFLKPTAI